MKNFFKKIWAFISKLWDSVDEAVEKATPIAIKAVEALKVVNDSFVGDVVEAVVAAIVPGTKDDKIINAVREKLKVVLPKVLLELKFVQSVADIQDPNEQIKAILTAINMSPSETRNAYYHTLSTMILQALSDGKLTWSESVHICEYYYTTIYKKEVA